MDTVKEQMQVVKADNIVLQERHSFTMYIDIYKCTNIFFERIEMSEILRAEAVASIEAV